MAKKKKSKKEEVEETVAETVAEVVEQEMVSSEEFESVMVALAEKENDILRARAPGYERRYY